MTLNDLKFAYSSDDFIHYQIQDGECILATFYADKSFKNSDYFELVMKDFMSVVMTHPPKSVANHTDLGPLSSSSDFVDAALDQLLSQESEQETTSEPLALPLPPPTPQEEEPDTQEPALMPLDRLIAEGIISGSDKKRQIKQYVHGELWSKFQFYKPLITTCQPSRLFRNLIKHSISFYLHSIIQPDLIDFPGMSILPVEYFLNPGKGLKKYENSYYCTIWLTDSEISQMDYICKERNITRDEYLTLIIYEFTEAIVYHRDLPYFKILSE